MAANPPPPAPDLVAALTAVCDDALFAITASARFDPETLRALSARRAPAIIAAAQGKPLPGLDAWESWVLTMCAAIAPIAPPAWMPMADAIEGGLSLQHGARGMRSLFTSKPSEKEVNRVRTIGAFAVRVIGAVLAASGTFHAESKLLRGSVIASLGLPDEIQSALYDEVPLNAENIEILGAFDAKMSRSIVRGAFHAALHGGIDPREEQAVLTLAKKLGLEAEEVNQARLEARALVDASKPWGEASVDAIRYLLSDQQAESDKLAIAAARLTLPAVLRRDALTAINVAGTVTLGKKHSLDRKRREAVLGLAWVVAARGNPTYARRAELASRHDRVAADLGDADAGTAIRAAVDRYVELELCAARDAALA